jgi:hypothetical protein
MISLFDKQIMEYGSRLAALDPNNPVLIMARKWWAAGRLSRYSNQDFDVLNGLVNEVTNIEKGWRKPAAKGA